MKTGSSKTKTTTPKTNEDARGGVSAGVSAVFYLPDNADSLFIDPLGLPRGGLIEVKKQAQVTPSQASFAGTPILSLRIKGDPKAQPRPRFAGGRVISTVAPAVKAWQADVQRACLDADAGFLNKADYSGSDKPLCIDVTFYIGTNKKERLGKPHTLKPDGDNLIKLIMDQMIKTGLIAADDCVMSHIIIRKAWCKPEGSGAVVNLSTFYHGRFPQEGVLAHKDSVDRPSWL